MSPEQFAALLHEAAASFGDKPMALELRKQVEALGGDIRARAAVGIATRTGRALVEANRLDDAQRLFEGLGELFPQQPPGPVGLAHIATRRGSWDEAVRLWDVCMKRFPHMVQPDWTAAQARAIAGANPSAPPAVAPVIAPAAQHGHPLARAPQAAAPVAQVGHPLARRPEPAKPAAATPEPAAAPARVVYGPRADAFATAASTLDGLLRSDRLADARKAYPAAFAAASETGHLRMLYMTVGPLFEGWGRTSALLELRKALTERAASLTGERKREVAGVLLRICLSLRDYVGFADGFDRLAAEGGPATEDAVLLPIAAKVRDRLFPHFDAEKVFGIGLSKTGTTSFIAALEMLGYSAMHWTNPATHELFSDDDLFLFDAFADLPTCEHFEQYYYTFPNARFVYTTRPFESWKRSYLAQVHAAGDAGFVARRHKAMRADGVPWGTRNARLSFGMYYNYPSIEDAFQTYDKRVRQFFADKPANRFLEFSLSDGHGWPELCGFLRRPAPEAAYPRKNPQKAGAA